MFLDSYALESRVHRTERGEMCKSVSSLRAVETARAEAAAVAKAALTIEHEVLLISGVFHILPVPGKGRGRGQGQGKGSGGSGAGSGGRSGVRSGRGLGSWKKRQRSRAVTDSWGHSFVRSLFGFWCMSR